MEYISKDACFKILNNLFLFLHIVIDSLLLLCVAENTLWNTIVNINRRFFSWNNKIS